MALAWLGWQWVAMEREEFGERMEDLALLSRHVQRGRVVYLQNLNASREARNVDIVLACTLSL